MIHSLPKESVTYLVGKPEVSARPLPPYASVVCDFLDDLSLALRQDSEAKAFADVLTFAFWCRKANLHRLRALLNEEEKTRLGLGMVFHIAPANVPVNFAFSYAFGLLSGNANVVRVPSRPYPQVNLLCRVIGAVLAEAKYAEIREMSAFVSYEAQDAITAEISSQCGARVVWGGDETIRTIRQFPRSVRSVEISFGDRTSLCAMSAHAVLASDKGTLRQLAERFFNDTLLMDQAACSSPHLVTWIGSDSKAASERFWMALEAVVKEKYEPLPVHSVDKHAQFCHDAVQLEALEHAKRFGSLYVLRLASLPENLAQLRGRYGYFYEYTIPSLSTVFPLLNSKFQTLTCFGLDKKDLLKQVLDHRVHGIDRIVEVGQALAMNTVWDGYDLIRSLSRVIDVG